ncbi:MAG: thioesterase domain-containing protein [Candidatus Binatia bacterium]
MTTFEFLSQLKTLDVRVWLEGDRLRCSAPSAVLTPELQGELSNRKEDILTFLRAAKTWAEPTTSSLVPLQPAGNQRPFFAVPGHNGDVFCFVPLARHLTADQPIYGLQPPGVDGQQPPLMRVEDLAAHFVKDIRLFQPEGPYRIGGYCLGGVIAFEIAQQLHAQGQQVETLVLFGSPSPTSFCLSQRMYSATFQFVQKLVRHAKTLQGLSPLRWRQYVSERNRQRQEEQDQYYRHNPYRRQVEDATVNAVRQYKARVYPGRITLFFSSEHPVNLTTDRLLNWRAFTAGGLEIHAGPAACDGDTMLLEPHAQVFAELLQTNLHKALN